MNTDLSKIKHIHFIGIGGIGISAIARMMMEEGKTVSGQDVNESENITLLRNAGAEITIGQNIEAIPRDAELIVYSRAIEVLEKDFFAKLKDLPIQSLVYPEMLGLVSKDKYTIAVSGCHGKTTTTGMAAHTMLELGADPTVVIGSFLLTNKNKAGSNERSNFIQGKSKYFVVEADEYYRAFLNLHPNILIITNIDLDHVDYYKNLDDIKDAYRELVSKVPEDGYVVCDPDNDLVKDVIKNASCKIVDYKQYLYERDLPIPGRHNQTDACFAYTAAHLLGYEKDKIDTALATFPGTARRFEYKGTTKDGTFVYDDYAHHPTEVKASLQAFREKFPKEEYKLHVFFQPHLFSRTQALFKEFAASFSEADEVIILPIFKAREIDDGTVSAMLLADAILKEHTNARAMSFGEARDHLSQNKFGSHDVIITMGAGDAFKIGESLLK